MILYGKFVFFTKRREGVNLDSVVRIKFQPKKTRPAGAGLDDPPTIDPWVVFELVGGSVTVYGDEAIDFMRMVGIYEARS